MKKFVCVLILVSMGMLISHSNVVFAGNTHEDSKLIGLWTRTLNSTDSSGNPCPFVPEQMEFFTDQSVIISNFGSEHLPYKTILTIKERQVIEERQPKLKVKNILLVKPNPALDWTVTPMVYGYSVKKDELTLILQGWSAAKFVRTVK